MATDFEVQINQPIRVARVDGVDGKDDWYASSVQDLEDNYFCISVPTRGPNPLILNNGDAVKVSFVSKDSRFECETVVLGKRFDNIQMYVLALPKEYKRIQLRDFVRLPIVLEMYYAELPEEGQVPVFMRCNSLDISGGGMRLLFKKDYATNTRLYLKFVLPFKNNPEEMEVWARVVRSWPVQNVNQYQVGVKFEKISRSQQDLIVRFILAKLSEQSHLR